MTETTQKKRGRPVGARDSYPRKRRSKKVTKRLLELRKRHPKRLVTEPT